MAAKKKSAPKKKKVLPKYRKLVKTRTGVCGGKKTAKQFNEAAKDYENTVIDNAKAAVAPKLASGKLTKTQANKIITAAKTKAKATVKTQRERACPTD